MIGLTFKVVCLCILTSSFKDIKNTELALFELSRVISVEPDCPEVFEQRAEVRFLFLLRSFSISGTHRFNY